VPGPDRAPDKASALRRHHALNPRPDEVADPAFNGGNPFFDAQDLVQVKYEMLRRVREDGQAVSQASATFGFSRPSFYEAQAAFSQSGLPGLVPQRPGPKRAHKLSEAVPKVCAPEGPICHQRGGRNNYADIHSEHSRTTQ
jgi:hypothetical protein